MTTQRLPSNWLNDPTDDAFVEKSVGRGLGTIIAGSPLVRRLAKAAEQPIVCKLGCQTILAKAEDSMRCAKHHAPWMIKGETVPEDETDESVQVRTVKSDDLAFTGGNLDHERLTTSKSRVRRPFTGSR